MIWNALTFSDDNVLTGSEMNSLQDNFSAMAAGNSGSPAIDVNSLVATGVASLTSVIISSLFTAEVVSAKQITVDSGIQADAGSFNQLETNSLSVDSGMSLIASSIAESGYTYLPNGLIIQWMQTCGTAAGTSSESWPLTFPNSILHAQICGFADNAPANETISKIRTMDETAVSFHRQNTVGGSTGSEVLIFGLGW